VQVDPGSAKTGHYAPTIGDFRLKSQTGSFDLFFLHFLIVSADFAANIGSGQ
jgi:hypothetical protein